MHRLPRIAGYLPLILCATLVLVAATGTEAAGSKLLRIMLQGESASEMRALVEQHGGTVTHDLPIIDAVGADVTADQLQQIRQAPGISRIIDDLSVDVPEPVPPVTDTCDVGGALEAQLVEQGIRWKLYNKHADAARLQTLSFSWPAALGTLQSLTLGDQELIRESRPKADDDRFTVSVSYPETEAPALVQNATLAANFATPLTELSDGRWLQRDFSLSLEFKGECSTKLIPGYPDYAADTYYPQVAGAAELHQLGVTGKGVTVAVLDSGLWEHTALARDTQGQPRILGRYDAIADRAGEEVFDDSGHGTHMTSVIAHSGQVLEDGMKPSGSFKGIAPDAGLVAVKAFDDEGQGDFLDIVRGVQWIVDHRERLDIKVLNLSFAARPRWPYFLDPINQALMRAWAAGITVVAAAGNEGPDAMTIGSPGNLPYLITVGAITDSWTTDSRDDDYIPDFSSRGPLPAATSSLTSSLRAGISQA
ncbi:S8 family serine peptidase [Kineobactrum salinum]|uniref:S8 family serine peptidase n=1 Tax=Kineobactrum salinum TaxID=2708301 RepID=A0A6C0U9G0_9GAMM|nr:S8 family serine peptidase [Kineobactrum salinum]QIB66294.1 S8 family serine peptidase [Kineobactrum salinum]